MPLDDSDPVNLFIAGVDNEDAGAVRRVLLSNPSIIYDSCAQEVIFAAYACLGAIKGGREYLRALVYDSDMCNRGGILDSFEVIEALESRKRNGWGRHGPTSRYLKVRRARYSRVPLRGPPRRPRISNGGEPECRGICLN